MHIPTITTASLDGSIEPIDLGQSAAPLAVLSFSDSDLAGLAAAHRRAGGPALRLAALRDLRHPMSVDLWVERVAAQARGVLVRLLGGHDAWSYGVERLVAVAKERGLALALLPGECSERDERLAALSTVPAAEIDALLAAFREGGPGNMEGVLARLARLGGLSEAAVPAAAPVPRMGLWHPAEGIVEALPRDTRPVVPILFYRSLLMAEDTAPVAALAGALEGQGLAPLPVFVPTLKDEGVARFLGALVAETGASLLIATTAFAAALDCADGPPLFERLGLPVLHAAIATTRLEAWAGGDRGLGANDMAMHCVLPELDGRIMAGAISFKALGEPDAALEARLQVNRPEPDGIAAVAARAAALVRLQRTPRAARRLVMILPDYPGAEGREGYAVGLDVFASALAMLADLRAAGWSVEDVPETPRALLALLREARPVPVKARAALEALPDAARATVLAAWGEPDGADLALRHAVFGAVTVCFAPDRGRAGERRADYHDPALPPAPALVAFGAWMQAGADAVVHLGAHGTLEWLPGKATALSAACFPRLVAGALPVVYPFIVSNPGEAAQAKRRIAAVTLGHLPPPLAGVAFSEAEAELERLVEEYVQADAVDRRRRDRLASLILARAEETGFAPLSDPGDDPAARIAAIDASLCDLKEMAVREGQHVYGRADPDAAPERVRAAAREREGLLTALDGRFVPPGPSGAPDRGRPDVLPTGRNLVTLDPRLMPTATAFELGRLAAEEIVRFHLQRHGDWPRTLVMDLWASASLRTGGEELACGLWLMGCRPRHDPATGRVTAMEVLPPALLGRPRVDVTFRLSGLFRDMFAAQIAALDEAVRAVAARDETAADNPLRAALAPGAAPERVFASAPGTYGAGTEAIIQSGAWEDRAEIGRAYLDATSHALGRGGEARPADGAFAARVAAADLIVHHGDDPTRDLLDGNADAAHLGGFAAAAHALGRAATLVSLDTADPARPRARDIGTALARVVRGRATRPAWIAGQMRHGPRGAADFAETVDRLVAFAETTGAIDPALIEAVADAYVQDEAVRAFLLAENPAAARAVARRLGDAIRRGLWQPRRNSTPALLAELLEEAEVALGGGSARTDAASAQAGTAPGAPSAAPGTASGQPRRAPAASRMEAAE